MRSIIVVALTAMALFEAAPARALDVPATIRDFSEAHADFEGNVGSEQGIVDTALGPDHKPVYAGGDDGTLTTTGPDDFAQWYNDVPGVNQSFTVFLPLTEDAGGRLLFESNAFFPIDDLGFGNEGHAHNYHFTTEVHLRFTYQGGETFDFDGDDDVYVFINGRLALDLGGVHPEESATLSLDDDAGPLGLDIGQTYDLDLFHAERHLVDSNFKLTTSIVLKVVDPPPPDEPPPDPPPDEPPPDEPPPDEPPPDEPPPDEPPPDEPPPDEPPPDEPPPVDDGDLGIGDLPDEDGDGVPDGCSFNAESGLACPSGLYPDIDQDGIPDAIDGDRDGDGVPNGADDDQDGDGIPNDIDDDIDGDGVANDLDQDQDGDGIRNADEDEPVVSDSEGEIRPGEVGVPWGGCATTRTGEVVPILFGLLLLRARGRATPGAALRT